MAADGLHSHLWAPQKPPELEAMRLHWSKGTSLPLGRGSEEKEQTGKDIPDLQAPKKVRHHEPGTMEI